MNQITLEVLITVCYELNTELGDRLTAKVGYKVESSTRTGYTLRNAFCWPVKDFKYWQFWADRIDEYLVGSELLDSKAVG